MGLVCLDAFVSVCWVGLGFGISGSVDYFGLVLKAYLWADDVCCLGGLLMVGNYCRFACLRFVVRLPVFVSLSVWLFALIGLVWYRTLWFRGVCGLCLLVDGVSLCLFV